MEDVEVLAPTKVVTTVVNVNSFISTLDHLPCDIVRSLWLIQSLNFKIDGAKTRMSELLVCPRSKEVLVELVRTKCLLQRYARELVAESRHLSDKLQWHKNFLVNDRDTMDKLVEMRAQIAENEKLDFEKFKSDFFKDLEKAASFQEYFRTHFGNKTIASRALLRNEKPKKVHVGEVLAHKPKITLKIPVRKEVAKKKEPTYCLCHGVSFGKMVACDNLECEIEWFHYKCVGLTQAPRGKWYCPNCTEERAKGTPKKKKRRKGF